MNRSVRGGPSTVSNMITFKVVYDCRECLSYMAERNDNVIVVFLMQSSVESPI